MEFSRSGNVFRPARLPFYAFAITFSLISYELLILRIMAGLRIGLSLLSYFVFAGAVLGLGMGSLFALHRIGRKADLLRRATAFLPVMCTGLLIFVLFFVALLGQIAGARPHLERFIWIIMALFPLVILIFSVFGYVCGNFLRIASEEGGRRNLLFTWAGDLFGSALGGLIPILLIKILDPLQLSLMPILVSLVLAAFVCRRGKGHPLYGKSFYTAVLLLLVVGSVYISLFGSVRQFNVAGLAADKGFGETVQARLKTFLNPDPDFKYLGWSPYQRVNCFQGEELIEIAHDGFPGNTVLVPPGVTRRFLPVYDYPVQRQDVLIIGAGGCPQAEPLLRDPKTRSIDAVELDGVVVDYVESRAGFAPYLADPRLNIIEGEGRHFLKYSDKLYDFILFPFAESTTSSMARSLTKPESYLYNVEALQDAVNRLKPRGVMIISVAGPIQMIQTEKQLDDFIVVALRLYRNMMEVDPDPDHLMVGYPFPGICLVYDRSGIQRDRMAPFIAEGQNISDDPRFRTVAMALPTSTDDRPFFFISGRHVPPVVQQSLLFILLFVLVLLVPVILRSVHREVGRPYYHLIYFFLTGFGFMLLVTTLVQRFIISFGVPALSGSVIITTILAGAGLGSFIFGLMDEKRWWTRIPVVCIGIPVVLIFLPAYTNALNGILPGFGILSRCLVAVVALLPMGVLLGIPFPAGMGWMRQRQLSSPVICYSLDTLGAVVGIVATLVISIKMGFIFNFYGATAAYTGIALLSLVFFSKANRPS